ncbi:hypothetical protein GGI42DRAFT_107716 [Trichoderma sp. SZMC 28013]
MGRSLRYSVPGGNDVRHSGDGPGRHVLKGRFRFPGCLEFSPHHKSSQSFAVGCDSWGFAVISIYLQLRHPLGELLVCTFNDFVCSQGNLCIKVNRPWLLRRHPDKLLYEYCSSSCYPPDRQTRSLTLSFADSFVPISQPQSSGIAGPLSQAKPLAFASRCLCESGPQTRPSSRTEQAPPKQSSPSWWFGACHTKGRLLRTQRVRSCHLRNDRGPPSRYDVRSSICFTNIGRHPRLASSPSQGSGEWRPLNRPTVVRADKTLVNPLFSLSSHTIIALVFIFVSNVCFIACLSFPFPFLVPPIIVPPVDRPTRSS